MTNWYELTKRYHRKSLITVCLINDCDMHRVNGEWIQYPKREGYQRYTHSLCPEHLEMAREFNKQKRRSNDN